MKKPNRIRLFILKAREGLKTRRIPCLVRPGASDQDYNNTAQIAYNKLIKEYPGIDNQSVEVEAYQFTDMDWDPIEYDYPADDGFKFDPDEEITWH